MIAVQMVDENQILQAYEKLVHYAIHKFYPYRNGVEYEDLFQIGSIALLEAYRAYKPDRGASFSTWAILNIKTAMFKTIRKNKALKRKGCVLSLDAVRNGTEFRLIDAIDDERAIQDFEEVLLKICLEEGSYIMPTKPIRKQVPIAPAAPVHTSIDLSSFIVFNASNAAVNSRDTVAIGVTKTGKVTLSAAIGARYQAGETLEVLINKTANIIVVRQSENGIKCRTNGKNTIGRILSCRALTNYIGGKKIDLPIRFRAEWDDSVQGFVGKR
ncbi:hypothetical protein P22_1989 [Propionispora sp. 2/2-37]|uniref:sigma-70 family RNA polymerase sigma factor n=1 Tax=Propionispora sp. 2/2-37 TaxID=1677858 RepID=UPI0006BB8857|nr:sigma-70 family RNA polymerase sigma factor [Propionispora sp. 2/2-37]CUH95903.1 hypothetical protein P22_1989 [Propionispora sp. 2/2-37]